MKITYLKRSGFTLIEAIVVMAIIGILMSLLLSSIQRVRHTALRCRCANNLHQVLIAAHHYHDVAGTFGKYDNINPYLEQARPGQSPVMVCPACQEPDPAGIYNINSLSTGPYGHRISQFTNPTGEVIYAYDPRQTWHLPNGLNLGWCDGHVSWFTGEEVPAQWFVICP